jgi:hypothetical protein
VIIAAKPMSRSAKRIFFILFFLLETIELI